ncbi:MAG: hypothetical protein CFE43_04720 [Burkholderiales bacterium PBB3]|nr:MAG: hypothetical protein CFE43_04720 [Burkholderiales bacterium PBB3]
MTRYLVFLLLLAGTWGTGFAQVRVVSLCYDETAVRPWVNQAGTVILKATAALNHIAFEQVALPWLRCLRDLAKGSYAGAVGVSFSDERATFAVFPLNADGQLDYARRMQASSYSVYRIKGESADWDGKSFHNLSTRVVAQRGYSVVGDLAKLGVQVDQSAGDAETVFKMLIAGRVQLGALVTEQGDELLAKPEFGRKLEKLKAPLVVKPYFLVFSKSFYASNTKLAEDLWNSLAVVRDSKEPGPGSPQKSARQ